MRTQVGIVGAGPAGLLLAHLLHLQGVESVVLERRDRAYVERRVRAGVLEHGTVQTLREAGVGKRMDAQGLVHTGTELRFGLRSHRIDFTALTGRGIMVYGQQEVVKDLIAARLDAGGDVRFEIEDVALVGLDPQEARIEFVQDGARHVLDCDFVIGTDGFHGVSRSYLPDLVSYERSYPFAWLGVLADAPPSSHELIYARHANGFALHSMRSPSVIRMYLQVSPDEDLSEWPDDRIWAELHARLADDTGFALTEGPLLDKGITSMRSVVVTPMQHGRLFLAGDAAHIVPPTGAKGMNLAVADVRLLSRALGGYYAAGRDDLLAAYTQTALRRVWRATHFSWWMTSMLHRSPDDDVFGEQLALAQLDYVVSSTAMATSLAENYTGLPYAQGWSYR
ncbi:4-hydroxybenzoate 3-monooxygenase [Frankia sp. Cas4]|uniref:4-hydroxybenzoate 3-monooxygenase n=1 Tax=Frankia sp. Cas4 TaxID=3073927 RepID=UPI002AD530A6|nr:4-hydroxybenzoate 3-monooxygenase [Frankia sp. Cas4]